MRGAWHSRVLTQRKFTGGWIEMRTSSCCGEVARVVMAAELKIEPSAGSDSDSKISSFADIGGFLTDYGGDSIYW